MFVHLFYPPSFSCLRVNVWAHRTRDCRGTKLGLKSENPAATLYVISLSGEGTQDCHFLLLNNVLTFLLALSRQVLCSDKETLQRSCLCFCQREVYARSACFHFYLCPLVQCHENLSSFRNLSFSFWLATILRKQRTKSISNCKCEGWKKCHQDPHQICFR